MKRCLLLSSMLLAGAACLAQDFLLPLAQRSRFRVDVSGRGAQLSGICIVKTDDSGSRGTLVNDFGIHVLDFTLSPDRQRLKLLNVMQPLNRWYVKKTVRKDLQMLFAATRPGLQGAKRQIDRGTDSVLTLDNARHKLRYCFKPVNDNANETAQ